MAKQKFDIKNLSLGKKKAEDLEKVVQEIAKSSAPKIVEKPVVKEKKVVVDKPKPEAKAEPKPKAKLKKPTRKKREPKVYAHSLLSEDTRRFTMDIPRKLYMKIKISAAEQDMTMKELVLEAVREVYDNK